MWLSFSLIFSRLLFLSPTPSSPPLAFSAFSLTDFFPILSFYQCSEHWAHTLHQSLGSRHTLLLWKCGKSLINHLLTHKCYSWCIFFTCLPRLDLKPKLFPQPSSWQTCFLSWTPLTCLPRSTALANVLSHSSSLQWWGLSFWWTIFTWTLRLSFRKNSLLHSPQLYLLSSECNFSSMLMRRKASTQRRSRGVLVLPQNQHCIGVWCPPSTTSEHCWWGGGKYNEAQPSCTCPPTESTMLRSRWWTTECNSSAMLTRREASTPRRSRGVLALSPSQHCARVD